MLFLARSLPCLGPEFKTSRPGGFLVVAVSIIQMKNCFAFCLLFEMIAFFIVLKAAVAIVIFLIVYSWAS